MVLATRREVAEAANVSVRTVSNVVNGFPSIAPETRARVLRVIEEMDYRPSQIARILKRGRSGLVALVLPELDTPYFAELTRAFVELGGEHGFTVIIDQTDGDPQRELELINQSDHGTLFDGVIVSPLGLTARDADAISPERPVVFLGEETHPGFDHVRIDNFAASREATAHLLASGRTKVAALGAQRALVRSSSIRLSGYRQALDDAGVEYDPDLIGYVEEFRRPDGAAAMARLLDGPSVPDAVFCFSDPLALGALRTLRERGVRVPEDVALVGFDDIEDGHFSFPTLTSVSPDKTFIASQALKLLSAHIDGTATGPAEYIAPHRLIIRESSSGQR
jgi:DNA-binding LacI/PurR family transcriptional regulator